MDIVNCEKAEDFLVQSGVGVIPTDTIYGIVGRALDKGVVERIYRVRKRSPEKPCIILISDAEELEMFGVDVPPYAQEVISSVWPGPFSLIFTCKNKELEYLHRGTESLAFRVPAFDDMRHFLRQTGPLIAPSANPEGEKPAENMEEIRLYFEGQIDFAIDGDDLKGEPSTVLDLTGESVRVIRQGGGVYKSVG